MGKLPTIELELMPFRVPTYVSVKRPARPRDEGVFFEGQKYHLSELSDDVLIELCDRFRADVMAVKAAGGTP